MSSDSPRFRDWPSIYKFNFYYSLFYRSIYKYFSNFNYQISISENISDLIINEGFNKDNVSCIYYGSKIPSNLKKNLSLNKKLIQVSTVARFLAWKNHIKIIDHFKIQDFKNFIYKNNIKFVFYGNGPLTNFLKAIEKTSLKKIRF